MLKIPMNDLGRAYDGLSGELESAALAVMRSGRYLSGPKYREFCQMFSASLGVAHCVGVGNGTDALELAIRAIRSSSASFGGMDGHSDLLRPEVITVANAGGYATTACYLANCVPVYADIERHDQLMSIPSAVASLSNRTLAISVTHLYGGLVDVPALRQAKDEAGYRHVPILEDCAQAHGLVGATSTAAVSGEIATFSFYPTKNLGALGDAGAIVTNDDGLAAELLRLHQYGWTQKYEVGSPFGRNSRMDELQAALLVVQFSQLDSNNSRRREILEIYQSESPEGVQIVRSERGTVAHLAVLMTEERDRLRQHLISRGVSTEIHYPVLDSEQRGWQALPKRIGPSGLAVSRECVEQILTIPCFPTMTDEEIGTVSSALASYVV